MRCTKEYNTVCIVIYFIVVIMKPMLILRKFESLRQSLALIRFPSKEILPSVRSTYRFHNDSSKRMGDEYNRSVMLHEVKPCFGAKDPTVTTHLLVLRSEQCYIMGKLPSNSIDAIILATFEDERYRGIVAIGTDSCSR